MCRPLFGGRLGTALNRQSRKPFNAARKGQSPYPSRPASRLDALFIEPRDLVGLEIWHSALCAIECDIAKESRIARPKRVVVWAVAILPSPQCNPARARNQIGRAAHRYPGAAVPDIARN